MDEFKFNFGEKALEEAPKKDILTEDKEFPKLEDFEMTRLSATVINVSEHHFKVIGSSTACNSLTVGPFKIQHINHEENQMKFSNSGIANALASHSDLVPGVYEGGLKIWECSIDLVNYLAENVDFHSGMNVLELGCGAGIPGILAHMSGASCVVFQDFNAEVLDLISVPNVLLNSKNQASGCHFVAGDWSIVAPEIEKIAQSFDIIVTSETIYNPSSQPKLLKLFKTFLKPKGHVYLAAKSCYFGVGGSVWQFEELIKEDGNFSVETCSVLEDGVKRVILKLNFKEKS